jgi:hypothetical protein
MDKYLKYRANPIISFKDEGDEGAVLYNPDTDKCVIVNSIGSSIWLYLEEPRTTAEIVSMITSNYSGVDAAKAQEDLEFFVNNFEEGFIDEVS